jgi:hypothetical protein
MAKAKHRAKKKKLQGKDEELIVIDEKAGLIFQNTEDLYQYFRVAIDALETEYESLHSETDLTEEQQTQFEDKLEEVLDSPDEVWMDEKAVKDLLIHHFVKTFEENDETIYYVASAYVSTDDETPTFVLLHFASKDHELFKNYQRGELIYDHNFEEAQPGAIEGDALSEGDSLALGLYLAMLKVRSEKDIDPEKFKDFSVLREETIETADEIWRKNDLDGNVLVSFIKEYPEHEDTKDLAYVAVTQEDPQSNVHSLLFSFPTTDKTLLDRYRQGENLQADEIVQESSH